MLGRKRSYAKVLRLLRRCDFAIEVVDARDPEGTRIKKLDRQFRSKVLVVASKADLLPKRSPRKPLPDIPIVFFSARTRSGLDAIFREIRGNARRKGLEVSKVVVFGLPNTGKSSLINLMKGRHSTPTGFRAGITKGQQWIKIGKDVLLLDTPGVVELTTSFADLVLKSAENVDKLRDPEETAAKLIGEFILSGETSLFESYGIPYSEDPNDVLEQIARRRGLLLKGGELNIYEASRILLRDFQKGKFVLAKD